MSAFVNPCLKKIGNDEELSFDSVVDSSDVIVLLGAPGCGKSTLLKHYAENTETCAEYLRVQQFLNIDEAYTKVKRLLLDGFDELRLRNGDSSEAIYRIISKINCIRENNTDISFVISCREIDWYGDDTAALKECCKSNSVSVYYIQPLNYEQKYQLIDQLIKNENQRTEFQTLFDHYDILDNPQILTMFVEVYLADSHGTLKTKRDVYDRFVRLAKEKNFVHRRNTDNPLSEDEIFKYAGYLAYCSLLSGTMGFDENFLSEVAESSQYPLSKLTLTTQTNLFKDTSEICFNHRTIAEFLCAHFLYNEKYLKDRFPLNRIAGLLLSPTGKKVLAEYRGVFAWLCSFSESTELIEKDPYGQFLYGDNSAYSYNVKKDVLKAIRKLATENPYFINSGSRIVPEYFYCLELDSFIISEYKECWNNYNHYLFLLGNLAQCSKKPSLNMISFAKEILQKENLPVHYKKQFVPILQKDAPTLQNILNDIINGKIEDKKSDLLDAIIKELYPTVIKPRGIVTYLKKYYDDGELFSHFEYLNRNISYVELKQLVKDLYDQYPNGLHHGTSFYYPAQHLVAKFFEQAINQESERNFLEILMYLNAKNISFTECSWSESKNIFETVLENKKSTLFELYLNFILPITNDEESKCWMAECNLQYYIGGLSPQNRLDILESRMNNNMQNIYNVTLLRLIYSAMRSSKDLADNANEQCNLLACKFGIEQQWNKFIEEPSYAKEWREKQKNREQERKERIEREISKNEDYFQKLTLDDKKKAWNYLFHVSSYFLRRETFDESEVCLRRDTYENILNFIKERLFNLDESPFKDELLLDNQVKKHLGNHTNLSELVNSALCMCNNDDYERILKTTYVDYCYITAVSYDHIGNVRKSDFSEWFEEKYEDQSVNILWRYLLSILQFGFQEKIDVIKSVIEPIICELTPKNRISQIKNLYRFHLSSNIQESGRNILNQFVENYAFELQPCNYEKLKCIDSEIDKKINLLERLNDKVSSNYNLEDAVLLLDLLGPNEKALPLMDVSSRIKVINLLLNVFNTEELLEHHSGVQTRKDNCAWFVDHSLFALMEGDEWLNVVEGLLAQHSNDYWTKRLLNKRYDIQQTLYGNDNSVVSLEKVKAFIFNKGYASARDFWLDICEKFDKIKKDVENNRYNQKNIFFGKKKEPKIENDCRDAFLNKLNDLYGSVLLATKEHYEANDKRVDINLKCRQNLLYEVQVECKCDWNEGMMEGIQKQLINQYFYTDKVEYGIYLVFCFERKADELKSELEKTIPQGYEDKIKVFCLDLKLS